MKLQRNDDAVLYKAIWKALWETVIWPETWWMRMFQLWSKSTNLRVLHYDESKEERPTDVAGTKKGEVRGWINWRFSQDWSYIISGPKGWLGDICREIL